MTSNNRQVKSDKVFARKRNTITPQTNDSTTEVNFNLREPRMSCSFKGNRELWKAFVDYSKVNYGSVCHILEPVMLAILESKVNLSRTIESDVQPIVIENLNVQRVLKRMRRYHVEPESDFDVEVVGREGFCSVCGQKADFVVFRRVSETLTHTTYFCVAHFGPKSKSVDAYRDLRR